MHTLNPQSPVLPQKSLHTCPQAFDGVKGQNALKTQHSVQAERLHHDPNSSNCSFPPPWPEAGGKEGPSFMTWAYVYFENILVTFFFAPWFVLDLP